jgi:transposase
LQDGRIEIVTANGRRVVVGPGIDVSALVRIVRGLEQL